MWWRENRPAAPDLLEQELQSVLALVASAPTLGAVARDARVKDVRRVLLRRTRYHVYYWVDWTWKSRRKATGRPAKDAEIRKLIVQMANANPTWGAPRIHGELLKLGFVVSQRTVSRYLPPKQRRPPSQTWRTFVKNHVDSLVAVDFFVVPTATFRVLYGIRGPGTQTSPSRSLQRHREPYSRVDGLADPASVPLGHGAPLPSARP